MAPVAQFDLLIMYFSENREFKLNLKSEIAFTISPRKAFWLWTLLRKAVLESCGSVKNCL